MTQSIYLAARYSRREEMLDHRSDLQDLEYTVTSRWIHGLHVLSEAGAADEHGDQGAGAIERGQFADVDLEDVTAADTIICFTEQPRTASRGGRHVELGIAIGQGKRVIVIGPRENVFCCLPRVEHFPSWADCLAQLQIERAVTNSRTALAIAESAKESIDLIRDQLSQISAGLDMARPDHPRWNRDGAWPDATLRRTINLTGPVNFSITPSPGSPSRNGEAHT